MTNRRNEYARCLIRTNTPLLPRSDGKEYGVYFFHYNQNKLSPSDGLCNQKKFQ